MEIYRNETATITLKVPVTANVGTFTVTATDGDEVLYTFPTVSAITGGYTVTLPFSLVDRDRKFSINWNFEYTEAGLPKSYSTKTYVEVVTPYVTLDEIREALGTMPVMTDAQLKRVERKIRGVIDSFTGQSFGRFSGTMKIQSDGEDVLTLPKRLISFSAVNGTAFTDPLFFATRGDGWYLGSAVSTYSNGSYQSVGVIRYPGTSWKKLWRDNAVYEITGEWGYEDVPVDVKEAALILIEDMICPDSEYRDRYIDSVKTADYQYMYAPGAFRGTGSVVADQLLAQYIRSSLAVI